MILIFGGAFQGKLEYALNTFHKSRRDVLFCPSQSACLNIEPEKSIICGLEEFVLACSLSGQDARELLAAHRDILQDKILITCDISQGIVPMDKEERAFREMMGRTLTWLAAESDQVYRVFCGLGLRLK